MTSALDNELSKKITDYFISTEKTIIEVAHKVTSEQKKMYSQIIDLESLR